MAAGYTPTPDYYRDYIQHGMMQMSEDEYLEHYNEPTSDRRTGSVERGIAAGRERAKKRKKS